MPPRTRTRTENLRFVMSARAVKGDRFTNEPGLTQYLLVPPDQTPRPEHAVRRPDAWFKQLRRAAVWGKDSRNPRLERGDVLFFVHGYNNGPVTIMDRHDLLASDLAAVGFKGVVLSFDWPSAEMAINYLEDRHDAKTTAMQLVNDGIRVLSAQQTPDCSINVHLLGHSTGAYVIREAFDDADDARMENNAWLVSQVVFIAGDVSATSLMATAGSSDALYRHCIRLTNYSNLHDAVLKLSNAKRLGVASRVGRVGLPDGSPSKSVNVDCSDYFHLLESDPDVRIAEQSRETGTFNHSWHIGNRLFAQDLFETLRGDLDRAAIPTRRPIAPNRLKLFHPKQPS